MLNDWSWAFRATCHDSFFTSCMLFVRISSTGQMHYNTSIYLVRLFLHCKLHSGCDGNPFLPQNFLFYFLNGNYDSQLQWWLMMMIFASLYLAIANYKYYWEFQNCASYICNCKFKSLYFDLFYQQMSLYLTISSRGPLPIPLPSLSTQCFPVYSILSK